MKLLRILSLAAVCSLLYGGPITLNQNAILNPGAEAGAGSVDGNDVLPIPSWITTGNLTSVQYGASAAPVASPGPAFGSNFFAGGPNTDTDDATQFLDVSNLSSLIDLSEISYVLSGYFGGYLAQNDDAKLFATFLDASNATIDTSKKAGGFNSTHRDNISQLLFDSVSGVIPVGTRSIEITLKMTKAEGFYNDGYADNLSFVATSLSPAPEPSAFLLSALGIGGLWMRRKARSRRSC
jgi:hypothetical protein